MASVSCSSTIAGTAVIRANLPNTAWRVTPAPRARIWTRDQTWTRIGSCYFGASLGAAVAVTLAVERPPAALILCSPFTSLSDMGRVHYPLLPTGPLLRDRFDSIARIGRVRRPVLVIAGDHDQIVPLEQSRRLHVAIQHPGPDSLSSPVPTTTISSCWLDHG